MASKNILLVDDEQLFLEALSDALEFERHVVRKASTIEAALNILLTERIDLATVDIMIPPGNSLEGSVDSQVAGIFLCEQIKRQFPQLKVIVMSVVSDKATINHVLQMGYTFLRKGDAPLRTVLDRIQEQLNKGDERPTFGKRPKSKKW